MCVFRSLKCAVYAHIVDESIQKQTLTESACL